MKTFHSVVICKFVLVNRYQVWAGTTTFVLRRQKEFTWLSRIEIILRESSCHNTRMTWITWRLREFVTVAACMACSACSDMITTYKSKATKCIQQGRASGMYSTYGKKVLKTSHFVVQAPNAQFSKISSTIAMWSNIDDHTCGVCTVGVYYTRSCRRFDDRGTPSGPPVRGPLVHHDGPWQCHVTVWQHFL